MNKDKDFINRVFVSHYCNIPYHLLDLAVKQHVDKCGVYPRTLVEDLMTASLHLIRTFELSPYDNDDSVEELVRSMVDNKEI